MGMYDIDFTITDAESWGTELKHLMRFMTFREARSVRLTVPCSRLRAHIHKMLQHTGFGHVFVTVPYLRPVNRMGKIQ